MEAVNDNSDISVDLMIALDLTGILFNDEETVAEDAKVGTVIQYLQTNDSPGGNAIDSNNETTTVENIEVDFEHTSIDNKMGSSAAELTKLVQKGANSQQLVKEANGLAKTVKATGSAGPPAGTVPNNK